MTLADMGSKQLLAGLVLHMSSMVRSGAASLPSVQGQT